jgi:hypothetical protein
MTSRNLVRKQVRRRDPDMCPTNVLIHGHVMVNAVQQEMDHQELGMIRQIIVDMKQEPVESVLEQRPDKISEDEG